MATQQRIDFAINTKIPCPRPEIHLLLPERRDVAFRVIRAEESPPVSVDIATRGLVEDDGIGNHVQQVRQKSRPGSAKCEDEEKVLARNPVFNLAVGYREVAGDTQGLDQARYLRSYPLRSRVHQGAGTLGQIKAHLGFLSGPVSNISVRILSAARSQV